MSPVIRRASTHTTAALVGALLSFFSQQLGRAERLAALDERTQQIAAQVGELRADVRALAGDVAQLHRGKP